MRDGLARRFLQAGAPMGLALLTSVPARAESAAVLTSARAVRELSPESAAELRPVRLQGVVTYHHSFPGWLPLFVQDASGGIYVEVDAAQPVAAGDRVEVDGFSSAGMFAPMVVGARIARVGRAPLPAPAAHAIDALLDGSFDSQWVELDGVVRRTEEVPAPADPADRLYVLTVSSGRHEIRCVVRAAPGETAPALVDARVRVRGAASTRYTARRQIVDVQIQTPGFEHVQVLSPAPADPFAGAVHAVTRLFQFDPRGSTGQRVRVQGRVSAVGPGSVIYLRDDTGGMRVELEQAPVPPLLPGDVLDVAGFPELGEYSPVLKSAVARVLAHGPVPAARPVDASRAMSGDFDGLPVVVEGTLVDRAPDREGAALVLRAGDHLFRVEVLRGDTHALGAGSALRVRGICLVQPGFDNRVRSFRVVAASAADVVVTRAGDWWTLSRALWAMAGLGALLAGGLVWNLFLRRRASRNLAQVRVLSGLLPICAWCKKIRDDNGYWNQVETYIRERTEADFSHGICPDCGARERGRYRRSLAAVPDARDGAA